MVISSAAKIYVLAFACNDVTTHKSLFRCVNSQRKDENCENSKIQYWLCMTISPVHQKTALFVSILQKIK